MGPVPAADRRAGADPPDRTRTRGRAGAGGAVRAGTSAGRPRDSSIDDRVLAATRALLVEVGYNQLTFGLVARTADVNRPAMYRRWPSKMHLVYEALFPNQPAPNQPAPDQPAPDQPLPVAKGSGDFETDLRAMIHRSVAFYCRPEARAALPGLLVDVGADDALRGTVVERIETPARGHVADLVARASERGQIVDGVDSDVLFDCIVGTLLREIMLGRSPSPAFADSLTDLLLRPVLRDTR
jgi:AcrR family transcriptional regulator